MIIHSASVHFLSRVLRLDGPRDSEGNVLTDLKNPSIMNLQAS